MYKIIYIYTIYDILLLGTTIAPHVIPNAQGLSENMEILSATLPTVTTGTNEAQGKYEVSH